MLIHSKITVIEGSTEDVIPKLREQYGIEHSDFVFIDHEKSLYIPDLKRVLETGLLWKGSVVLADNMIYPGMGVFLYLSSTTRGVQNRNF